MSCERCRPGTEPKQSSSIPKIPTCIRGLDEILHGGLPTGRTTIFNGKPGTGKSILALEFLYRGAIAGEPGIFVSFEERAEDIRLNAAGMGMDIEALEAADKLKIIHAELPQDAFRAGDFDCKGLLAQIEGFARLMGAKRVVLDAIDVLMWAFADPVREREEIYFIHNTLRDLGMTTVLTAKLGQDGERNYPFLDFMVDCVLHLDQRMSGQVRTRRLNVLKYRGSDFMANEHPYLFSHDGIVLMPVSSAQLIQPPIGKRVSSGVDQIDAILGGGYKQGTCILVAGPSGSGKTSLACTFAHAACNREEKVLYVDYEVSRETLLDGMQSIGLKLESAERENWLRIVTAMPESDGVEGHLLRILNHIAEFNPQHLVLDAISASRRMGSERAAFDFLMRLMTECKKRGITCFYLNQTTGTELISELSGIGLSSLVDTILALDYFLADESLCRRLLVVKSRGSAHSHQYHYMSITNDGIILMPQAAKPVEAS
ncbi:circadian clock protein KaiC [Desulfonatronum thiosulfatophilum]|uniref:non-specific serine/threonine protein kinase n=1 Tax=Desulfonatronum thiosulfatophilum TaxID=617002 RepID=A0A1G6ESX9_9BACT|nr:circadian clock protein KaiC [Desulfonatronum thiosulfatophilum]SDB60501.1 circadian clock protein KaiC [Desulfonatronum thiosulfatophilum]